MEPLTGSVSGRPGAVLMAVHRPDLALLRAQIGSLRSQTVTGWSCVVGIDGRDPAAASAVARLVAGDDRFTVREYPENVGVYRNFERLLADLPADAAWVSLADQDDRWYPDKLGLLLPLLDPPGAMAATGQARLVDAAGRPLGRTRRRPGDLVQTLVRNQLTGSLSVLRREVVELALPFPAETEIAIHDHWLAACAAQLGTIRLYDGVVQDYVQHGWSVLGEARPHGTHDTWRRVRAAGGVRSYLDQVSEHHWGWRVAMAHALADRATVGGAVTAFARGRLSLPVVGAVARAVLAGRFPVKAGLGMLAASAWWRPDFRRPLP